MFAEADTGCVFVFILCTLHFILRRRYIIKCSFFLLLRCVGGVFFVICLSHIFLCVCLISTFEFYSGREYCSLWIESERRREIKTLNGWRILSANSDPIDIILNRAEVSAKPWLPMNTQIPNTDKKTRAPPNSHDGEIEKKKKNETLKFVQNFL